MEKLLPVVMIGGFVALIGGIIYIAWLVEKKRTEAMTAWAQSHGFQFEGERPQLIQELNQFKLFNQGHSKRVRNLMRGAKDIGSVRLVDYQYTTGSGKHRTVWNQTVCVLTTPGKNAPHFFCRRQRALFDSLGKLFGGQDINFDDDPTFSKAFVLQTAGDEQQLRHFMSPRVREALSRLAGKNIVLEVVGETMVFHLGKRMKPEDLDTLMADAINVRRTWG